MYRIGFCITCKSRLNHLSLTLPKNLEDVNGYKDAFFVVLDYNDNEGLADYIQNAHKGDLDSGRIVYYRTEDPQKFHMAHAKNMAHRLGINEGADILVNLDADNWTGYDFASYIARRFDDANENREAIFLGTRANHRGPGDLVKVKTPPGCSGRIAETKNAFFHAGGYDEIFNDWSPDDKDFGQRLQNLGYGWRQIRPDFLHAIKHGVGLRFKDYERHEDDVGFREQFELRNRQDFTVVNHGCAGTGIVFRNFETTPILLDPFPSRIFGIGLHKTATTSLWRALKILGYDAAHWETPHWAKRIYDEMNAMGRSRTLEMHYALCDLPIPLFYKELDKAYPGSAFILTLRDEDDWVNSIKAHWEAYRHTWGNDPFSNECHVALYGTTDPDEETLRNRYRAHNAEVLDYFSHLRPGDGDLLVMDFSKGAGWKELCRFLDKPLVEAPFPHRHRSVNVKERMKNETPETP